MNIAGMKIVVNPVLDCVPKMQVSEAFARTQTPELVAETNKWMAGFFGYKSMGIVVVRAFNTVMCGSSDYDELVKRSAHGSNQRQ